MSAHQLQHVKEVVVLEALVQWELHVLSPVFSHECVTHFFKVVLKKFSVGISQVEQELVQVAPQDEFSGHGVVLLPYSNERVDVQLLDWQIECIGLADEGVYHNGDKQVQEDLRDYYLIG